MKQFYLCLALFCSTTSLIAQWQPTGISTNTIEGIYDVTTHNGILFASANTLGFIKSTNNGSSWVQVGQTGVTTNPTSRRITHIKSTGTALYVVTFDAINASSMIYKSTDDGQTFVSDVVGLPTASNGEAQDVDYFYANNGYLVTVISSGNYIKSVSGGSWQLNSEANTQFSEHFTFYGSTMYAWGSYHLNKSTDNGVTWSKATDTNLPSFFLANNLAVNPESGRLYVSGRSLFNFIHTLYYSDNEGVSWVNMNIGSYLGLNWINQTQTIQSIFAKGSHIQLSLDNNAANSVPDVLVSTDGGATFSSDTSGLPTNAGSTTKAIRYVFHNDAIFMALNYIDIYKKSLSALGISDIEKKLEISVYPNPSNDFVKIISKTHLKSIEIFNSKGQLLKKIIPNNLDTQIPLESSGIYFLRITTENNSYTTKKVIRI